MASQKVPVIIGVGEIKNPSRRKEDAIEPLDLMLSAIKEAAHDASSSCVAQLLACVDSVSVVASSTWRYKDLPELVSEKLGVRPSHKAYSALAGSASIQLIDDTARLIVKGEAEVGVVVGGEAMASCMWSHLNRLGWMSYSETLYTINRSIHSENLHQNQLMSAMDNARNK